MSNPPIAHYLEAASASGFLPPSGWQSWADSRISRSDEPEHWLLDVALARDRNELRRAIDEKLKEERAREPSVDSLVGDAVLGYYYLNYQRGKHSLEEFLTLAAQYADSGTVDLECEAVYRILNDVERRRTADSPMDDLIIAVNGMFEPLAQIARVQFAVLKAFEERS